MPKKQLFFRAQELTPLEKLRWNWIISGLVCRSLKKEKPPILVGGFNLNLTLI